MSQQNFAQSASTSPQSSAADFLRNNQASSFASPFQTQPRQSLGNHRLSSALPVQNSLASSQVMSPQVMPLEAAFAAATRPNQTLLAQSLQNRAPGWFKRGLQGMQQLLSTGQKAAASPLPQSQGPLIGIIDTGFAPGQHGQQMLQTIQSGNPEATILLADSVGKGTWADSLTQFVDTAKATGQTRAVVNASFDLTQRNPNGSVTTRHELTAPEKAALNYARENGVLVVASAGNEGGAMSALGQASQLSNNLIVVGSAKGNDRAFYSSYGKGLDLVADVGTAGTSLAAAKTTGAITQMWSDNPGLSNRQISQILTATPTDLNKPGWDAETGSGLLNTKGAIELAKHTAPESIVFSGAQLIQQVSEPLAGATWESRGSAVASERTNRFIEGDIPRSPAQATSEQRAFELHRQMERDFINHPQSTPPPLALRPNPLDVAAMEQPNPTPGQVAIQKGDTLWDVAQEQLGSGDRWRELRKPDGSPFTEQEASRLQVGTSVQIPGAQPNPIETPPPLPDPATPPAPPPPAPAPNHVADFFGSVGNKLWEAGEGVFETVTNPGQAVDDLVNSVHTIANDPGQALNSFAKPYLDAFNSGRYGDLGGQLAGDALLAVSPGGLAVRINNVLGRLPDAPPATIPSPSPSPTLPDPSPATIPSPSPSTTLPEPPPVRTPSPSTTLPEPTPVRTASPSPALPEPTSTPALNPPDLPPSAPAPDLIASIPDDVGNALREMGDGETLDTPPSSVPPAPQSGSPGNGGNISLQNPLTDSGSPSSSGSELADPNVSRLPAAENYDRQLVTVGARDLDQTSSSTDRLTADSRNYEPVAVGGGNSGNRPPVPSTAAATPSATTRDRNSRADSAPAPRSGGSGGGNKPPRKPPAGGGGPRPTGGYDDSNNDGLPGDGTGGTSGVNGHLQRALDNFPDRLYMDHESLPVALKLEKEDWEHILEGHVDKTFDPEKRAENPVSNVFMGTPDAYLNILKQAVSNPQVKAAIQQARREGHTSVRIDNLAPGGKGIAGQKFVLAIDLKEGKIKTFHATGRLTPLFRRR